MLLFSAAGQTAFAENTIDISGDGTSIYADLWARVLENGEDIIAFPSRVTEELDPGFLRIQRQRRCRHEL